MPYTKREMGERSKISILIATRAGGASGGDAAQVASSTAAATVVDMGTSSRSGTPIVPRSPPAEESAALLRASTVHRMTATSYFAYRHGLMTDRDTLSGSR